MKSKIAAALVVCAASAAVVPKPAGAEAPWTFRFGVHDVAPDSDNGTLAGGTLRAGLDDSVRPTASIEYMFTPNLGADLLVAWPFEHTLKLNGASAATLKQLPPTFGINWHFVPDGTWSPFIGVGLNYTIVFDEKTKGPLAGTDLSVGNSWGPAAHLGLDIRAAPSWLVTVDARWINIEATARVDGANVGKVKVNPWVFGVSAGYRF
jgi:outer membrane protein